MTNSADLIDSRLRDLSGLVVHPRENLGHELKGWLDLVSGEDRANLSKAILALVNHSGGHIVIGIDG